MRKKLNIVVITLGAILFLASFLVQFNASSPFLNGLANLSGPILLVLGLLLLWSTGSGKQFKNGVPVTGQLVSVVRAGSTFNGRPQYMLTVQFTAGDGRQVMAAEKKIISSAELAQYQPGMLISLQYNPRNPRQVMVGDLAEK